MKLHGILPNKAQSIEFPSVPKQYMSHFIRGYFDGDGHVKYKQYTVTFVGGSRNFMKELNFVVKSLGLDPQFKTYKSHYRVHIRGRKSIKVFAHWIYNDNGLHLKRKYKEFANEKLGVFDLSDRKDKWIREKPILNYIISMEN